MTFDSMDSFESYLKKQMASAIQKAEEQIYQVVSRFLKQYYVEYAPVMYEPTYQLYQSLVKSEIVPTTYGFEAHVYFALDKLDYSMKYLHSQAVANKGGSEEKTLTAAAHGSHGGWQDGTAVWDESIEVLDKEGYNILKRMLPEIVILRTTLIAIPSLNSLKKVTLRTGWLIN